MLSLFAEFAITNNPNDPDDHVHGPVTIDPRSGKLLPHDQLNKAQKHAMAEAQAKGLASKLSGQASAAGFGRHDGAGSQAPLVGQAVHFERPTGRVIREEPPTPLVTGINEFLTGMHLQHFQHCLLRWFYVLGGLMGCVCIATGTMLATLAIQVANRLLPADLAHRDDWEKAAFRGAWIVALVHAFGRTAPVLQARIAPAWREQCRAVTALAVLAVLLNWATTGDHIAKTIGSGYWLVAGLDLALAASAALEVLICLRVEQATMAALVWVMAVAGSALAVAFTLSWRPQMLAVLVAWLPSPRRSAAD